MTETNDERRVYGVSRIKYEALVEVGGAFGPSFEAQALDLSEGGMHLRTQYLPEMGQPLTCRFDLAAGTSVLASGEVAWLDEQNGEFGLRFTELDAEGMDALREICGPVAIPVDRASMAADEPGQHDAPEAATFADGTRVRLHIEGLGSPMRARVRNGGEDEIVACSDLAFLQLGRPVELEHAELGDRRMASIADVEVELPEDGMVPQLVVRLRYAGQRLPAGDAADVAPPARQPSASAGPSARSASPANIPARAPLEPLGKEKAAIASASNEAATKLHAAAGAVGATFAKAGPAIVSSFLQAKNAVARMRGQKVDADGGQTPMRVTSPAPGGGLHTSGRKVVRGDDTHGDEDWNDGPGGHFSASSSAIAALAPHKTKLMAGGVLGLAGVLLLVALHKPAAQAPLAAIDPTAAAATSAEATTAPAPVAGATGTTATDPGALAANGTSGATLAPTAPPVAPAFNPPNTLSDDYGADTTGETPAPVKKRAVEPFGNGPVAHGNVLHIKMDGPIEKIEGAATPNGFTVVIPGRKSVDAAGPLAQRDERLASIKMTNEADSAELNVAFRDGVPNYQVRAHGSTLDIALAPIGSLAEAKHSTKERQHNGPTHKHGTKKHHHET
jgi:hypothetical protein